MREVDFPSPPRLCKVAGPRRREVLRREESAMKRPRVLLADDHTLLLEAFEKLLEPVCEVVGTAADGHALLSAAFELEPDIVVLDISMPRLNGLEAARRLIERLPETRVVFLTVNEDPGLAAEALRAGASGYVLKKSAVSELFDAIEHAIEGRTYVTPLLREDVESLRERSPRPLVARLTPRQREVLQLLAEGHSMKEAAAVLSVKPRTVAFHKYRMMDELGLRSNAELVQFAIQQGVVSV